MSDNLRESLAFALESGKMGTWDIDLESDTVTCSPEMLRLWGVDPEAFDGNREILQSKVHPSDRQLMVDAINDAIARRAIYEFEYRIHPSPGQTTWVLSRGRCTFPPGSDKPVRFAGVVYDITERKLREEKLASALKARDTFFMTAGHELRTPLACLHLQIEVLNWELRNNHPEVYKHVSVSQGLKKQQEHLFRLSQIIDNILSEARSSKGSEIPLQSESVELQDLVGDIVQRLRVIADASSTPINYTPEARVVGRWDRSRIEQVVINLVTNALKYGNRRPVTVHVGKSGQDAVIIVRDQGIGIAPEDHERIFEQFERVLTTQRITGMGLGLYISRNIVRAHGGDISLKSALNEGAEFRVSLPLSPA